MYNDYFGFTEPPFSLTPDPRFSYCNALYQEAFATLRYGIEARKGFIVITGEAGTGKTTLLRRLMQSFGRNVRTAYIFNTHLSLPELLRLILNDLGLPNRTENRLEMVAQLNEYLIQELKNRDIVTLLVDEAQELSMEMLEEIRLLSNLETDTEKLLQIVLMGQPELERKLDQPELRQLKQRVALRCRLDPLPPDEVGDYIKSRLKAVGYSRKDLFHPAAIEKIAAHSRGIPRLVNIICDNALLIAFAASKKAVSGTTIDEVARDLRLDKLAPPKKEAPSEGQDQTDDELEHVEGFRSTRTTKGSRPMSVPASRHSDFFDINIEDKPVYFRSERKVGKFGFAVLAVSIILGLTGVLVYSQQMWGGLTALGQNIKGLTGLGQSDPAPAQPVLPEKTKPDPLSQVEPSLTPGSDSAPAEQQQVSKEPEDFAAREKSPVIENFLPVPPVEERRSLPAEREAPESRASVQPEAVHPAPWEPAEPSRKNVVSSDRTLESEIRKAIANRAIQGVTVFVVNGTAYLRGSVATQRQRLAAVRAAQNVQGVKLVENEIIID
jgi:general secretion pathway protein A